MERDKSFDFIKGVLIFLVVWGHVISSYDKHFTLNPLYIWIYSFHMPLFIFVSGYFAGNVISKSFAICMKSRFKRLFLPALCWTLINFIFISSNDIKELGFIQSIYNSFRSAWFLYCLFALYLITCATFKLKHKYGVLGIIIIVGYISYPYHPVDVIKHFQIIRQLPLFVMGLYYASHKDLFKNNIWKTIYCFLFVIYLVWLCVAAEKHQLLFSNENYIVRGIILIIASVVFYVMLKKLYSVGTNIRVVNWITIIGANTLGIYMLNSKVILFLKQFLHLDDNSVVLFVYSVVVMCICYALTIIIKCSKFTRYYLLGEK